MGFDSVDELNSSDYVGDVLGAVEQPPALGGGLHQFEDHRQAGRTAAAPLGPAMPQSHRSERALDGVGRSQMLPVLGGEVVEGEQLARGPVPRYLTSVFLANPVAVM